jgi:hypothetical protein
MKWLPGLKTGTNNISFCQLMEFSLKEPTTDFIILYVWWTACPQGDVLHCRGLPSMYVYIYKQENNFTTW